VANKCDVSALPVCRILIDSDLVTVYISTHTYY